MIPTSFLHIDESQKESRNEIKSRNQSNSIIQATQLSPDDKLDEQNEPENHNRNNQQHKRNQHEKETASFLPHEPIVSAPIEWGCICNHSILSNFPKLITCKTCSKTCHVVCYGVSDQDRDSFQCKHCCSMIPDQGKFFKTYPSNFLYLHA